MIWLRDQWQRLTMWCTQQMQNTSIYANVYRILWIFALLGAVTSYLELQTSKLAGVGLFFTITFALFTIYQQYAVYQDLHAIETGTAPEYGIWINMRLERVIRYGILISLLFGVGKVANVVYPLFTFIDTVCNFIGVYEGKRLESIVGTINVSEGLFVIGSLSAFFCLMVWNIGALWVRLVLWVQRRAKSQTRPFQERVRDLLISARICAFFVSVVFCLAYWFTAFRGSIVWISHVSEVFFGLYVIPILIMWGLRNDRRLWLENYISIIKFLLLDRPM